MPERFTSARVRTLTPAGQSLFRLVVTVSLAFVALVPSLGGSRTSNAVADSFDDVESGQSPAHWAPISGEEREWAVLPDLTAPTPPNILANIWVGAENGVRSILVRTDCSFADATIRIRLKPMGGLKREAAGVVWRYRAPDKYGFARVDFAKSTVAICVLNRGTPDCVERSAKLDATSWSTLTVNVQGRHVRLTLEGQPLIVAHNQHEVWPGKAGLWSASSSVTFFDDFKVIESAGK